MGPGPEANVELASPPRRWTTLLWHFVTPTQAVRKITVGPYENNVYIVACRVTGQVVIVDAAAEPDRILQAAAGLDPTAVLTTHGHHDHVGAADDVAAALDIPVLLHERDHTLAGLGSTRPLPGGVMRLGDTTIEIAETPGHTPGSVSVLLDGAVLTGDTLFPGGPGATRFSYSDFDQIMRSVRERLFTLGDDTLVFPGHGLDTTIGAERPNLGEWERRGW